MGLITFSQCDNQAAIKGKGFVLINNQILHFIFSGAWTAQTTRMHKCGRASEATELFREKKKHSPSRARPKNLLAKPWQGAEPGEEQR